MKIVSGTGSRSLQISSNATKHAVFDATIAALTALDPMLVLTGMAEGFDSCLARAAYRLQIPYTAVLPTKGYGSYYWGRNSLTGTDRLAEFEAYLDNAWEVRVLQPKEFRSANFERNEVLVNEASHVLVYSPNALSTTDPGVLSPGTRHAFGLVQSQRKPFTVISPNRTTNQGV